MVTSNLPRELSERVSLCFTAINYQNVGDKKQEKRNTRKKYKRQEISYREDFLFIFGAL